MKKDYKEILIVGIFTAFMGQVYYYPFGTDFRITFGVITFLFLMIYFKRVPVMPAAFAASICVIFLRTGIDVFGGDYTIFRAILRHFPAFMYYICYGFIIDRLDFRDYTDKPVYFLLLLSSADILSNIVELFIRRQFLVVPIDSMITTVFLTAFLRGFITMGIYWTVRYFNLIINKEVHQKRYKELIMLTTKLESEILFLKKSMADMENAMEKAYSIYTSMKDKEFVDSHEARKIEQDSLSLSIDIHEIKKDYHRLVASMEKLVPSQDVHKSMTVSEMFDTIKDIFTEYPEVINKRIELLFEYREDLSISQYLIILSILNNLIQNSVEASDKRSPFIKVRSHTDKDNVYFRVVDNGKGIPPKDREMIFDPGFTTKFDPETGHSSTGLGLAHVRMLLDLLEGNINLSKTRSSLTEFVITIPRKNIVQEE